MDSLFLCGGREENDSTGDCDWKNVATMITAAARVRALCINAEKIKEPRGERGRKKNEG